MEEKIRQKKAETVVKHKMKNEEENKEQAEHKPHMSKKLRHPKKYPSLTELSDNSSLRITYTNSPSL